MSGRVAAVLLAILALCALVVRFDGLRDRLGASRMVAIVEGLTTRSAQVGQLSGRLLETNLLRLKRAAELDPHDVTVPIARGGQYLLLRRPHAAERAYLEALEIEQRAEIWANLVRVYESLDDAQAADRAARRAIALDQRMRRDLKGSLIPRRGRAAGRRAPVDTSADEAEPDPATVVFRDSFETGRLAAWRHRVTGSAATSTVDSDSDSPPEETVRDDAP